jgi:hypothetical protein
VRVLPVLLVPLQGPVERPVFGEYKTAYNRNHKRQNHCNNKAFFARNKLHE